eukprot:TRINITY_DN3911_c0_g1_i1.p1 TRINITY_DN3911_c0_g1~~TRINITY_DN3911_c0_g1_i1.p1  ORF type:complete len:961 (-),score=118.42 TRINITY_DN3911_c0_g1_i1:1052-3934(-)
MEIYNKNHQGQMRKKESVPEPKGEKKQVTKKYILEDGNRIARITLAREDTKAGINSIRLRGVGSLYDSDANKIGEDKYHFKAFVSECAEVDVGFLRGNISDLLEKDPARPEFNPSDHFIQCPELIAHNSGSTDWFFVVTKYYPDGTLDDQLKNGKKFSDAELLDCIKQLLEGLIHSHNKGLVLRAITPDHIFVVKDKGSDGNTFVRYKIGGLEYIEPYREQLMQKPYLSSLDKGFIDPWSKGKLYSPGSDAYILGLVIYYIATRKVLTEEDIKGNRWQSNIQCITIQNILGVFLNPENGGENKTTLDAADIKRVYDAAFKNRRYREGTKILHITETSRVCYTIDEYTGKNYVSKSCYLSDKTIKEKYEEEKANWEKLSSLPFVVQLLDAQVATSYKNGKEVEKGVLIAEEFTCDLSKLFKDYIKEGYLSFKEIIQIAWELGQAVYAIHTQGFVHRDIKPENIFLRLKFEKGKWHIQKLFLGDFGISKEGAPKGENVGTEGYKAPEVMKRIPYDNKVDVWGYGLVLFFSIFQETPYDFLPKDPALKEKYMREGIIEWEKFQKKYCTEILPKKEEDKAQSELLLNFLKRCLTVDPSERPTMREVLKDELFHGTVDMLIATKPSYAPYVPLPEQPQYFKRCSLNGINYGLINELLIRSEILKRYEIEEEPEQVLKQYYKGLTVWSKINEEDANSYNLAYLKECFVTEQSELVIITNPFSQTLKDYIAMHKGLKEDEIVKFARDIINGIAYLHKTNISHRCIRPENIYVLPERTEGREKKRTEVRIGGLNYARVFLDHKLTLRGINCYDGPEARKDIGLKEQVEGEALKKLDTWSYGAVLFNMLFGKDLDQFPVALEEIEQKKLVSPVDAVKNKFVFEIMQKCLKKDPLERPTAEELLNEFKEKFEDLFPKKLLKQSFYIIVHAITIHSILRTTLRIALHYMFYNVFLLSIYSVSYQFLQQSCS